jgi:hypothetical protein
MRKLTPGSSVSRRLVDTSAAIMGDDVDNPAFMHVIMSQVGLPYRELKGRDYIRDTKRASLVLTAGFLRDPRSGKMLLQGLPYGAKPRLLMLHFCTQAMRLRSPVIPVEESMTAFMRVLGSTATGGKHGTIAQFKEQVNRLTASRMQFAMDYDHGHTVQLNPAPMVNRADLWFPRDERQRVLWPSEIQLSDEFYNGLKDYALPIDPRAFRALGHSARALDIYTWLAHRLRRVKEAKGAFVSWIALQEQFGPDVKDPKNFRRKFLTALHQVLQEYPTARVEPGFGGLLLRRSPSPVIEKPSVRGVRIGPIRVIEGTAEDGG